ncbi:iron-containing redox enzyme family protein [Streptomyces sp. R302]|uniref:iron-containing redox enzyme family protein n=1 Tax=unclassified Streptomyces TaxID=2593676 RepID=UPI00145EB161|nr:MULTISPECIES: iron-containing redox enzyme family protein [unclassified Streptomyces]NML50836.1 iron-containing redox enzyme family protein [Streptomyces sp. R301]NML80930.1 iron-containing redox enzyme family protein [Streptomyces sp. R302]
MTPLPTSSATEPESARAPGTPEAPEARGEVSGAIRSRLLDGGGARLPRPAEIARCSPYGEDLQLALHLCYELHYRGFAGVPDTLEWDPGLLGVRALLEHRFESALRHDCSPLPDVGEALDALLVEPADGTGVPDFLMSRGESWHLREYAALRSVHQLREADPHLWVVPRLLGRAKAAMVAVEYDEYGCGRPERMHSRLYADLMAALDLDPSYGRYTDAAGAELLAASNLMSLFGLHRRLRGALVGHFAVLETTSPPAASRIAAATRRTGAGAAAGRYFDEHVEADAVHEQVVRRDVVGGLLDAEPALAPEVAFGITATCLLEDRLAAHVVDAWSRSASALRTPLSPATAPHMR